MKKILVTLLLGTFVVGKLQAQNTGINTKNPNSSLTVNGSYAGSYKTIAADATLTNTDQFVNVLGSAAAVTLTLPNAVVADAAKDAFYGRVYHIKNTSAFDVTIKGNGTQLLQIDAASIVNTFVLKPGLSVMVVKNTNNTVAVALWDVFLQSTAITNNNNFEVHAIKSFKAVVPASTFTDYSASNKMMNGKNVNNTINSNRRSAYELSTAAEQAKFIVINGLRMDFLQSWRGNPSTSPKLFNTTAGAITYNISSLSTGDRYVNGANTTIAPGYYSFNVDGNDDFSTVDQGDIEYVNAMLTFTNGEWYNCTWHATRDATNYYFYFTAQRLN
ncbi:hypothetical protein CLV94_1112 [Flavobacterium endophyticum]|uniref:DUF5689 domain-containing protein n=1 Tax=Flavobacterium endophyticum TaxID=1540163 RepID=A0A495ML00_9FLAO|nr:hypothetical protein [Flavobacterium endophyticum]RKS26060.1 hypothetical protein CLV94_1112 [Flavobacterium endophyticum]